MAIAADAFFVAHRPVDGLTQRNADVFHSMVAIDVKITLCLDFEVNQGMTCNLVQHVIKETNAGLQPGLAAAVKIHFDRDFGLGRITGNFSSAIHV
jgi:hypothetical protein